MKKIFSCILVSLLLCAYPLFTNGQPIRFYNSVQGLPSSLINDVSQDGSGYIWISTENGVSYFDGMHFVPFSFNKNKPGSLSSEMVKIVFPDSRGVCWVGTSNGLQIFDSKKNVFQDFSLQYPSFTETSYVSSIIESPDHQKLLVSLSGFGIFVYNIENHLIDSLATESLKNVFLGNKFLGKLFFDSQGFLWTFSEQGNFFKVNFQDKKLKMLKWSSDLLPISKGLVVTSIAEDPITHNILIGTYKYGLLIYDHNLDVIRKPKDPSLSRYRIRALLAESSSVNGNEKPDIWVGLEDFGLQKFNRDEEILIKPDFQYVPIDLENCKVHSLMQDNQGNIWAGIYQKGLLQLPKSEANFDYIKLSASQGSMSTNIACATSCVCDHQGNYWIGTDGGGLFKMSKNGTKTRFTMENAPLPNNAILTLSIDKRGTIWISTYMGGIIYYNEKEGFKLYSTDVEVRKVFCTLYDEKNDKLYLGTYGHGIKTISYPSKKMETLSYPDSLGWISNLYLDEDENLWIGETDDYSCFNVKDEKERYAELTSKVEDATIYVSFKDQDGLLWVGSINGLYCLDPKTSEVQLYTEDDGLVNNRVVSILGDDDNNLWIGTLGGMSRFDIKSKTFKNYYVYDGLQDNEFRTNACYKDLDGKMFFGGMNGFTSFYPSKINKAKALDSKLYFSGLYVLSQEVNYDESLGKKNILDKHISQARQITLKKNQNVFSLEFTALEYTNPQRVIYGYKLDGFDTDWRYTRSSRRMATYTNLPDGSYVFRVKAFFDGSDSEKDAVYNEINIRILPAWYKTYWAYGIYLLIFMLAVWEIAMVLIRRKMHAQERLESERKEMKLKMFTDISHEIRTPLTLVMSPLKSMCKTESDPEKQKLYNLMYRNLLRILRLFNQLIDVRKIDNHQMKMHFQKTDLIFFLLDIMKSFEQLSIMRNIDLRLVSDLDSLEVWIDQSNFDKVIFNVLSNAFKFTPDNGYVMISIETFKNTSDSGIDPDVEDLVEICIENSGSKIDEKEIELVFDRFYQCRNNLMGGGSGIGLHLAKTIVNSHYGSIKAKNVEKGVDFLIRIPLGNSHLPIEKIVEEADVQNASVPRSDDFSYVELQVPIIDFNVPKESKKKRTVIFIDDDVDMGIYIRKELSEWYNVEICSDSKEAWKMIVAILPDAVVTDLLMPDVDGMSLCRKIKQSPETNHLPVIILTSQTEEETERRSIESGADHYLTKPISLELLKSTIAQAIQTRDMLRNKYQSSVKPDFNEMKVNSPDSRLVSKVVEIIRKNIENADFSVDDLSREVGISRVHLNRKMKELLNISPGNLIKSVRLKQAAYLLINNRLNVSEVAFKLGYSSHSYFSNSFKEYFGMSPTEFVLKYTDPDESKNLDKLFEF